MRRRSVREKSLSAVARSTIGLIQRLSLEVTVWIMPVNVLSALASGQWRYEGAGILDLQDKITIAVERFHFNTGLS